MHQPEVRELGMCFMTTYKTQIVYGIWINCDNMNYSLGSVSYDSFLASGKCLNVIHSPEKAFSLLHQQLLLKVSLQRLQIVDINFQPLQEEKL